MSISLLVILIAMWRAINFLFLLWLPMWSQSNYFAIQRDGLWGMEDRNGDILIVPKYAGFQIFPKFNMAQERNLNWKVFFSLEQRIDFPKSDQVTWFWDNLILSRNGQLWSLYEVNESGVVSLEEDFSEFKIFGNQLVIYGAEKLLLYHGNQKVATYPYHSIFWGNSFLVCFEWDGAEGALYDTYINGKKYQGNSAPEPDKSDTIVFYASSWKVAKYHVLDQEVLKDVYIAYHPTSKMEFVKENADHSSQILGAVQSGDWVMQRSDSLWIFDHDLNLLYKDTGRINSWVEGNHYTYALNEKGSVLFLRHYQRGWKVYEADSIFLSGTLNKTKAVLHKGRENTLIFFKNWDIQFVDFAHFHEGEGVIHICTWGKKYFYEWKGDDCVFKEAKNLLCLKVKNLPNDVFGERGILINNKWKRPINTYRIGNTELNQWGRWNEDLKDFEICPNFSHVEELIKDEFTLCRMRAEEASFGIYDELRDRWALRGNKLIFRFVEEGYPVVVYKTGSSESAAYHFRNLRSQKDTVLNTNIGEWHYQKGYLWFKDHQYGLYNLATHKIKRFPNVSSIVFTNYEKMIFKSKEGLYGIINYDGSVKVPAQHYHIHQHQSFFELVGHQANFALSALEGKQFSHQIYGNPKVTAGYFTAYTDQKRLFDSSGVTIKGSEAFSQFSSVVGECYMVRKGKYRYVYNMAGKELYKGKQLKLIGDYMLAYPSQGMLYVKNLKRPNDSTKVNIWGEVEAMGRGYFWYRRGGLYAIYRLSDAALVMKNIHHIEQREDGVYELDLKGGKALFFANHSGARVVEKKVKRIEKHLQEWIFYKENGVHVYEAYQAQAKWKIKDAKAQYLGWDRWVIKDPNTQVISYYHAHEKINESRLMRTITPFNQNGFAGARMERKWGVLDTNWNWKKPVIYSRIQLLTHGYFMIAGVLFSPELRYLSDKVAKLYEVKDRVLIYRADNYRVGIADLHFNEIYPPIIDKYKMIDEQKVLLGSWEYKKLMNMECEMLLDGSYQELQIDHETQTVSVRYFANLYHYDLKQKKWIDRSHEFVH